MGLFTSAKSQAWYIDFAIGLFLFVIVIALNYNYLKAPQAAEEPLKKSVFESAAISNHLMGKGYPSNWTNGTALSIGIFDDYSLNASKVKRFKQLNYTFTKQVFGISGDYFVLFSDVNGNLLNIYNICGIGDQLVNITYPLRTAYYYQDPADSFLKDFMNQTFKADIYYNDANNDIYGLHGLIKNISKYGFVSVEHPAMSTGDYNNYKPVFENYTNNGGLLMLSGELVSGQSKNMVGVDFYKKSGQALSDRDAKINQTDPYLSFELNQDITFRQAYYVVNTTAVNFTIIASFKQDNNVGLGKWKYGNGTVYFFSDLDTSYFSGGNFVESIKDFVKSFMPGECDPKSLDNINITIVSPTHFSKIERYGIYQNNLIKMMVYSWN